MSDEPRITFEELMQNLDKYTKVEIWTTEQDELIRTARSKTPPVSYRTIASLWIRVGWEKIDENKIKRRWYFLQGH